VVLQRICVLTSTLLDGVKLSVYDVCGETTVLRYERWSVVRMHAAFGSSPSCVGCISV